jgi:tRNA(Ile)-lysidine synthase
VLLHLARGAGLPGLSAMAEHEPWDDAAAGGRAADDPRPSPPGGWLRPLLALTRDETRALAERLALPFVDDPTNLDRSHPRVRMRLELLPALRELNPRVDQALARAAEHARAAEDALDQWAAAELRARRCPPRPPKPRGAENSADAPAHAAAPGPTGPADDRAVTSPPRWSTEGMAALPGAVRQRIVRRVCRAAGAPDDALPARTLASIDDALLRPGPRRAWDLHPDLCLHLAHGELWTDAAHRATNH